MKEELKTIEVARIYESQGYFHEAFEIYAFLDERETSVEVKAGLKRVEHRKNDGQMPIVPDKNISMLCQEWLRLVMIEHRLDTVKKIKSRSL